MSKNRPPSQRQLKAGELIRRALAEIIAKENLRDPDLQGVSVTISEVRASPDLKHAIVYAVPLGGDSGDMDKICLLYTSPSPRDRTRSRMPSSA